MKERVYGFFITSHNTTIARSESYNTCSCKCCNRKNLLWREFTDRKTHHISENETTLSIGMMNLNTHTILCFVDIKRFECIRTSKIINNSNYSCKIMWYLTCVKIPQSSNHSSSTRHITFHIKHSCIWLDLETTSIKYNSFPYKNLINLFWIFRSKNKSLSTLYATSCNSSYKTTSYITKLPIIICLHIGILPWKIFDHGSKLFWWFCVWWKIHKITSKCECFNFYKGILNFSWIRCEKNNRNILRTTIWTKIIKRVECSSKTQEEISSILRMNIRKIIYNLLSYTSNPSSHLILVDICKMSKYILMSISIGYIRTVLLKIMRKNLRKIWNINIFFKKNCCFNNRWKDSINTIDDGKRKARKNHNAGIKVWSYHIREPGEVNSRSVWMLHQRD